MLAVPIRIEHDDRIFFSPVDLDEAVAFRAQHPGALIVSGGTETGLARNSKRVRAAAPSFVVENQRAGANHAHERELPSVGASVTWTDLEEFSRDKLPLVHALTERFGSPQIRNAGTLVGNIAYGSPVADSLCFLLVTGAELELAGPGGSGECRSKASTGARSRRAGSRTRSSPGSSFHCRRE